MNELKQPSTALGFVNETLDDTTIINGDYPEPDYHTGRKSISYQHPKFYIISTNWHNDWTFSLLLFSHTSSEQKEFIENFLETFKIFRSCSFPNCTFSVFQKCLPLSKMFGSEKAF